MKLVGKDPDGWYHEAEFIDEGWVDIASTSPEGDCGGAATISIQIFIKNYKDVTWEQRNKD